MGSPQLLVGPSVVGGPGQGSRGAGPEEARASLGCCPSLLEHLGFGNVCGSEMRDAHPLCEIPSLLPVSVVVWPAVLLREDLFFLSFETGFHYVAVVILELTV